MRKILLLSALTALSACSSAYGPNQPTAVNRAPIGYEETIKKYLATYLRDPQSLRDLTMSKPVGATEYNGWVNGGGYTYRYRVCAKMNAKNAYGGYTGQQSMIFMFSGDKILEGFEGYC